MSRRMLTASILVVLLAAIGGVAFASHSWGGYHWARTSNPFTLKVGDNVNATWDPILNTTISDWSASSVLNLTKVAGGANPKNCRPTSGQIEVCNSTYGNNGWLGIAQIWLSSGHISQGITKVNDTYYNTPTYNTTAWRNLVMCQEVGHDLGLDHQDETFDNPNLGTCMDYTNNPGTNQHPNSHDYAQLETIYAHLDSFNSWKIAAGAGMPPAMRDIELDDIGQWGRLVGVSDDGRSTTFEADFGGGHKVVTHVIWTFDVRSGRVFEGPLSN